VNVERVVAMTHNWDFLSVVYNFTSCYIFFSPVWMDCVAVNVQQHDTDNEKNSLLNIAWQDFRQPGESAV